MELLKTVDQAARVIEKIAISTIKADTATTQREIKCEKIVQQED